MSIGSRTVLRTYTNTVDARSITYARHLFECIYSRYTGFMREKNAFELRFSAQLYREMSPTGDDLQLQVALLQLAHEFEQEAERLKVNQTSRRDWYYCQLLNLQDGSRQKDWQLSGFCRLIRSCVNFGLHIMSTFRILPVSPDVDFGWVVETTHESGIVKTSIK